MFQVWMGPAPGRTEQIVEKKTRESAERAAKERVLLAKQAHQGMVASVFSCATGVVVSGFATEDLREEVEKFPMIEIL